MDGVAHGTTGLSSSPDSFGFQADILIKSEPKAFLES